MFRTGCLILLTLMAQLCLAEESPYTGLETREIKALSSEEIEGYLAGRGMGYALAAELNGYPGPKHVLELADELELSVAQREQATAVFDAMQATAIGLGERIVEAEDALDDAFAEGTISNESLEQALRQLGALEGELRGAHLAAHLEMKALLTPHQVHRYVQLRGYEGMDHSKMDHSRMDHSNP